jgi:hypothetical protein
VLLEYLGIGMDLKQQQTIDVFRFVWHVPQDGFQWLKAWPTVDAPEKARLAAPTQMVLSTGLDYDTPYQGKVYHPLKAEPALFRKFADLPIADLDAIRSFANEYGNLGTGMNFFLAARGETILETIDKSPRPMTPVIGMPLDEWVRQIDDMHQAVEIWDLIRRKDRANLSRFVSWAEAEYGPDGRTPRKLAGWYYDSRPDLPSQAKDPWGSLPPSPGRIREWIEPVMDLCKPGDVFMPALFLVQRWVNNQLQKHVIPRLLYHTDLSQQVLQIIPSSLVGAMWLQLAQAIAGKKDYRTCKECGRWFEVSGGDDGRTARRLFCDNPCKSRDYRRRMDRARELKAEGKTVKEIANELDTDVDTIKKWVSRRKGR